MLDLLKNAKSAMTSEQDLQYLRQAAENTPLKLSTERYRDKDELAFLLSRLPMATPRPLKVILAGAGFSGISFARAVDVGQLKNVQLQIYEKNSGIGGTWFENRYPGYENPFLLPHLALILINIS